VPQPLSPLPIIIILLLLTGGRLGWAAVSDYIGRRPTFFIFTLLSAPLYFSMPYFISSVVEHGSVLPLYAFIGSAVTCISFMGGTYAILPPYEADIYGAKNVGSIHGVMMAYSALAALVGPNLLLQLRKLSEQNAFNDLLSKVAPSPLPSSTVVTPDNRSHQKPSWRPSTPPSPMLRTCF
jgi:MFS family permease